MLLQLHNLWLLLLKITNHLLVLRTNPPVVRAECWLIQFAICLCNGNDCQHNAILGINNAINSIIGICQINNIDMSEVA